MKGSIETCQRVGQLLLLSLSLLTCAATAQEELVDIEWGQNGRFHSAGILMNNGSADRLRLRRDSHGRVLEAANLGQQIQIRRMNSSLQADTTFAESGLASLRSPGATNPLNSLQLAVMPVGANADSIVVATQERFQPTCMVGRLEADGRIAEGFGRLGLRVPVLPGNNPVCRDLAVDADSIYLLFSYWQGNIQRLGVAKFDVNLNPRLEFGNQGVVLFEQEFQDRASRLSVSGGRIVIGAAPVQLQLFQLISDSGELDADFATNGIWTPPQFQEVGAEVWDILHHGQDLIVLYARIAFSGSRAAYLRRFSSDGQPRLDFGDPSTGICTLIPMGLAPFQGLDALEGTLVQHGAHLRVLAGIEVPFSAPQPRVFGADAHSCAQSGPFATGINLAPTGSLVNLSNLGDLLPLGDNLLATYSKLDYIPGSAPTAGRVLSPEGEDALGVMYSPLLARSRSANQVLDVGLQQGRLVFAGKGSFDVGYLTAAEPNGTLASSFGENGSIGLPVDIGVSWLSMAAHVGETSTIFAGTAYASPGERGLDEPIAPVFYKLDADGQPYPNFGENGVVQPSTGANGTDITAITQDGSLIVALARDSYYGPKHAVLYRLLADGSIDSTFGTAGVVRFAGGARASDELSRVATTHNHVFTAGIVDGSSRLVLYLFDRKGVPVNVGNPEGRIELNVPGLLRERSTLDLVSDGDAALLVAFTINASNDNSIKLWRILSDGSVDAGFGTAGVVTIPVGWVGGSRAWIGRDQGRILVSFSQARAGSTPPTARFKSTLLVLNADGTLDASVGDGGRYEIDFDPGFAGSTARALATPARFLIGGRSLGDNSAVALRKAQGPLIFNNGFE